MGSLYGQVRQVSMRGLSSHYEDYRVRGDKRKLFKVKLVRINLKDDQVTNIGTLLKLKKPN